MALQILPLALAGLLFMPRHSSAAAVAPRNSAEHVILFNCHNSANSYFYSTVGYYSGSPSGAPAAVVTSRTGATTIWEGAPASVTFSDGDVFTWNIPARVSVGTYAGTAKNNYVSFYCYDKWNSLSYSPNNNGDICTCVYDCNHTPPSSDVPGDQTQIYYNLNSDYVELPVGFSTSVHDMLNNVYSKFDQNSGMTVDSSSIDLGNGVSISFNGHGDIAGTTLKGLADILVNVVAGQQGMEVDWTTSEDYCKTYCATSTGSYCCDTETMNIPHRKVPSTVEVYAMNTASNSDQGSLTYQLTYTAPGQDCGWAQTLGNVLGVASLLGGDIGAIFGNLATSTGIVSSISGC
ncbi:hypothetical protein GQ53DRAFT_751274 [Thozetella sp. PMI_491]|nr:hypothetical protein GQ53DRAFT_751274 [Thozetella sp. PMI_491]